MLNLILTISVMKKKYYFFMSSLSYLLTFTLFCLVTFYSCESEPISKPINESTSVLLKESGNYSKSDKTNTFYGPAVPIGKGIAQAYVMMSHLGSPVSVGIRFSEKSLGNLSNSENRWTLKLPNKVKGLSIDHIDLGWNPHGHEPPGVYDLPHFDIHFYTVSEEYVNNINNPVKAEMLPAPQFWPATYFPTPGFVPNMGKHWLSGLANEIQPGGVFSQTFIYGSYDGAFIFYEPMITLDYLNQKGSEQFNIFQPSEFLRTGLYYPTTYSITYDSTKKEYRIALENMSLVE